VNPGEANHVVILYLPSAIGQLPNPPSPAFPENTIFIVTSRGNVFAFQWPFQPLIGGQSLSAFSFGVAKIAYQPSGSSGGYDSIHDYSGASGHTAGTYCHNEPLGTYPAPSNYAEQLTVPGAKDSGVLTFVDPWITQQIFDASDTLGDYTQSTWLYIYADIVNTGNTAYTISSGSIDLTYSGSNHLDASLLGIYYDGNFYATTSGQSVQPGTSYYAIFKITTLTLGVNGGTWPPSNGQSAMFWGSASLTDNAEDQTYFAGTILLSGLWVRASC
jgi:hypothetical protein